MQRTFPATQHGGHRPFPLPCMTPTQDIRTQCRGHFPDNQGFWTPGNLKECGVCHIPSRILILPILTIPPPPTLTTSSDFHCLLIIKPCWRFPRVDPHSQAPQSSGGTAQPLGAPCALRHHRSSLARLPSPSSVSALARRFAYASSCHLPSARGTRPQDVHFKEGR